MRPVARLRFRAAAAHRLGTDMGQANLSPTIFDCDLADGSCIDVRAIDQLESATIDKGLDRHIGFAHVGPSYVGHLWRCAVSTEPVVSISIFSMDADWARSAFCWT